MIKELFHLCKSFSELFLLGSDLKLLAEFQNAFNPNEYTCDCGEKDCHLLHTSTYTRTIITVIDSQRAEYSVEIVRLHFSCGHSHAVIPDFLIPYASYTIRFILHILNAYTIRTCAVSAFCDHWQISVSTLYDWIHRFCDHYRFWADLAASAAIVIRKATDCIIGLEGFSARFMEKALSFTFLQNKSCLPVTSAGSP